MDRSAGRVVPQVTQLQRLGDDALSLQKYEQRPPTRKRSVSALHDFLSHANVCVPRFPEILPVQQMMHLRGSTNQSSVFVPYLQNQTALHESFQPRRDPPPPNATDSPITSTSFFDLHPPHNRGNKNKNQEESPSDPTNRTNVITLPIVSATHMLLALSSSQSLRLAFSKDLRGRTLFSLFPFLTVRKLHS